jgi:hypothetical protein
MAQTYQKVPADEYGSYHWLMRECAGFLGWGYNVDALDPERAAKLDSIVQSGIAQFYYPPPLPVGEKGETMPHRWSFLTPVAELNVVNGTAEYALEDDFAGAIEDGFTVGS